MNNFMFFKNAILVTALLASTVTLGATVTIHCNDKKTFTFEDLMDSPEEVGKEKCKNHEGYNKFTAQFVNEKMMVAPPPVPVSK